MYGIRVPDDGTVTFYREIKSKMGFGVHRYYDKIYLQLIDMGGLGLQRAIETDIQSNGSRCEILIASVCKNRRDKVHVTIKAKGLSQRFEERRRGRPAAMSST